jgi:RNA polymerase sigma factor for flagellar operon FliA
MRDAEAMIAVLERQKGRPPTDAVYHDDPDAAGEAEDPLSLLEDPKLRDTVIKAIDALPERERLVMSLYHEHQLNHAEIGAVLGMSEPQVSEMYTQAVARIRAALWKR